MFDFDDRSLIVKYSIMMGCILIILFFSICLSGCAVSGCGNPVSHNNVDSNDYIDDNNIIVLESSEYRKPQIIRRKQKISHQKIKSKYTEDF